MGLRAQAGLPARPTLPDESEPDAPPTTPEAIAHALGDQQDHSYPIFHDDASHAAGDLSDWTIATALFDLRKATLTVFAGNPRKKDVLATVAYKPPS